MSVFAGQEIAVVYQAVLLAIKKRISEIPFRRLKDLRPDEIDDFASDFYLDKVEADFENPIFRTFVDSQGWIYNPLHGSRQPENVLVNGRKFVFEVPVTAGAEYVRYSPRGGAEQFDLVFVADEHFKEMELKTGEDGNSFIVFSLFIPESVLGRLPPDKIAEYLSKQRKEYLTGTIQRLNHLNGIIDTINRNMGIETKKMIAEKIKHDSLTEIIAGAVGIQVVPRNSQMEQGKRIEIIPKKLNSPLTPSGTYEGYFIDSSNYKSIIETIRQHLIATESLPTAIQKLDDEELIRDTILWALQSTYFIASGETFRQAGKTDISIIYEDKSAFVAECKIWRGASTIQPAIDQLLDYTTWRDSKACIIIFNLGVRSFDKVCTETLEEAKRHSLFKAVVRTNSKNDFALTFQDPLDEQSLIEVSFLIANYVTR